MGRLAADLLVAARAVAAQQRSEGRWSVLDVERLRGLEKFLPHLEDCTLEFVVDLTLPYGLDLGFEMRPRDPTDPTDPTDVGPTDPAVSPGWPEPSCATSATPKED